MQADMLAGRRKERQTGRQEDRQAGRQSDRKEGGLAVRQVYRKEGR